MRLDDRSFADFVRAAMASPYRGALTSPTVGT
jgi:hypothetical protein